MWCLAAGWAPPPSAPTRQAGCRLHVVCCLVGNARWFVGCALSHQPALRSIEAGASSALDGFCQACPIILTAHLQVRTATILAGFPVTVPAMTVNRWAQKGCAGST